MEEKGHIPSQFYLKKHKTHTKGKKSTITYDMYVQNCT